MILSTQQLADLLGVTTRRVNQLAQENITIRSSAGKFDAVASVQNYIGHVSTRTETKGVNLELDREKTRLAREQADQVALKNAMTRREMLPRDEVEAEWTAIVRKLRVGMMALPSKIRQRLGLNASDTAAIDREIRDTLTVLGNDQEV